MKTLTLLLLLISGSLLAQSVPMQRGQPFPFESGLGMAKPTVDSTRTYVKKLQYDYTAEVNKNRDLETRLSILQFDHDNQTAGYQGTKTQLQILAPKYEDCTNVKKRRFWVGFGIGIVVTTGANIAALKL